MVETNTPRACSTKTRIKTISGTPKASVEALREHVPLKQGLRLRYHVLMGRGQVLREHVPLKQGLRLCQALIIRCELFELREHVPLKQGLRR